MPVYIILQAISFRNEKIPSIFPPPIQVELSKTTNPVLNPSNSVMLCHIYIFIYFCADHKSFRSSSTMSSRIASVRVGLALSYAYIIQFHQIVSFQCGKTCGFPGIWSRSLYLLYFSFMIVIQLRIKITWP